jgi:hypothetical protein
MSALRCRGLSPRRRVGVGSRAYLSASVRVIRHGREAAWKTLEVAMLGQLALVSSEESVVPAAVWETLPAEAQTTVTIMLARLLAAMIEEGRDE